MIVSYSSPIGHDISVWFSEHMGLMLFRTVDWVFSSQLPLKRKLKCQVGPTDHGGSNFTIEKKGLLARPDISS